MAAHEALISAPLTPDTDLRVIETLYHNANGYLGVRNSPEDGMESESIRGTYLNGFYELMDIPYGEKLYGFPETKQTLVNVPDAQTVRLWAGDRLFRLTGEDVREARQELLPDLGTAERTAVWRTPAGSLRVRVTRLASFCRPNLFLLRFRVVSLDYTGPVRLLSGLDADVRNHARSDDPRVSDKPLQCLRLREKGQFGRSAYAVCDTLRSGLTMACAITHEGLSASAWQESGEGWQQEAGAALSPGEEIEWIKYAVYADSLHFTDPLAAVKDLTGQILAEGADSLAAQQRETVRRLQETAFASLSAPGGLPAAFRYDQYQLLQSTGTDGICNVASKGISGEGYEGHIFWDSEIYVFPFFLWTQPEKARNMLLFRWRQIGRARENARLAGIRRGILYPWRSINGAECSAFFPAGTAQYHINGDVAYAFLQYWRVTGDLAFMAEKGAEVLVETARAWIDLGHMDRGFFKIDCVTGPDEYTCLVNNNFYTNAIAGYHLQGTAELLAELKSRGLDRAVTEATGVTESEADTFRQAAEHMYLPVDPELGISPQDDSFLRKKVLDWRSLPKDHFPLLLHYHPLFLYRHQVCKQADTVLAHLLFPESAEPAVIRKSWDYYDRITTHDSSLSHCVFAMAAARLGKLERAVRGFEQTATLDLLDTHGNTRDGLHTASLGGAYLTLLRGFAGVRVSSGGLEADPILPPEWDGYEIPLAYRGRRLLIKNSRTDGESIRRLSGDPVSLLWHGKEISI